MQILSLQVIYKIVRVAFMSTTQTFCHAIKPSAISIDFKAKNLVRHVKLKTMSVNDQIVFDIRFAGFYHDHHSLTTVSCFPSIHACELNRLVTVNT